MAMGGGSSTGISATPNVTPMIDVMLVLLVIFMIVIPSLISGFNAVPPQGVNLKSHPPEDTEVLLGIDRTGQYYLQKQPIRNETLYDRLKTIYDARTEDKILYLRADKDIEYGKVIDVLDVAGKAGVRVTGMIADQQPGTQSTVPGDDPNAPASAAPGGGRP
jgi:biopolymer transport protein TolR